MPYLNTLICKKNKNKLKQLWIANYTIRPKKGAEEQMEEVAHSFQSPRQGRLHHKGSGGCEVEG